jgi:hypothetical protein
MSHVTWLTLTPKPLLLDLASRAGSYRINAALANKTSNERTQE